MKPRVLFYVQHLLGIGHVMRACRIAKALRDAFEVRLVVGGELPSGIVPDGVALTTGLRVATCCFAVSTRSRRTSC